MNYEEMSDDEINYEVAKHSFDEAWLERHYGKEGMVLDYCNSVEDACRLYLRTAFQCASRTVTAMSGAVFAVIASDLVHISPTTSDHYGRR